MLYCTDPRGWAQLIRVYPLVRIVNYRVNAKRMRIPHPLYGINIPPTLFHAEWGFHLYTPQSGPNRPAPGPVAPVATPDARPYQPKIAWGLRMPTPK
jgi:hypothetical protein